MKIYNLFGGFCIGNMAFIVLYFLITGEKTAKFMSRDYFLFLFMCDIILTLLFWLAAEIIKKGRVDNE